MEAVNDLELRIVGLSRSGNHCLIDWILHQSEGRYCFLNCAEGKSNPFETARPLDDGRRALSNMPDLDLEAEREGRFAAKDLLLHSYEDSFLGHACSAAFEARHDRLVGRSRRRLDLLVLRDPFNLFASRRRMGCDLGRATALTMWKQHARAALAGSRHLRHPWLAVSYNHWLRSEGYRRRLAARLGLDFTDGDRRRVARCAGGSSFDGLACDGEAESMAVLQRWRRYADDPDYLSLFDGELRALSRRLFGEAAPEPPLRARPEPPPAAAALAAPAG